MDTNKTILIIEDDEHQQQIYTHALQKAGFNVIARDEAMSGLRWLEQILPDLILLDVMLPGMSGLEMLEEIRSTENGAQVPIVIATASADISNDSVVGYDVATILHKPIMPSELVETVRRALPESL